MPIRSRTNNRIVPANSRAVDVARQTLKDVIPVQQRKYDNAFQVQGYETVVYQRLHHGPACSCQNHRGASASYLNQSGKMEPGTMESLLKNGLTFKVDRYGARPPTRSDLGEPSRYPDGQSMDATVGFQSGGKQGQQFKGSMSYDIVTDDPSDIFANDVVNEDSVGDNGPVRVTGVDDISDVFDGELDLGDTKCAICFGTGYIGGFTILNGWRKVFSVQSEDLIDLDGTKEYNKSPHAFRSVSATFELQLPIGALSVDAFRVWNNDLPVAPSQVLIDGLPFSNTLLMALCDGGTHEITIEFQEQTYWTHLEIQLNQSSTVARFELPRTNQSSNLSLQDATDDLNINASPVIPSLQREDVLVESTYGKVMVVQSSSGWNDRDRNVLGWDVQTRIVQPEELLYLLPRRNLMVQKSTFLVRDNMSGIRRT